MHVQEQETHEEEEEKEQDEDEEDKEEDMNKDMNKDRTTISLTNSAQVCGTMKLTWANSERQSA